MDEPPPRVHARLRRRLREANAHNGDSPSYLLSDIPPTGTLEPSASPTCTSARDSAATPSSTPRSRSKRQRRQRHDDHEVQRQRRRATSSSFTRSLAFALRFGDFNLVYSGQVTGAVAHPLPARHPGAGADRGTVPAVGRRPVFGRCSTAAWSGCSTATRPPTVPVLAVDQPDGSIRGSGLGSDINYVRNSVKATVDAYDGTIHFYVVDPSRPDHPHVPQGLPRPLRGREGHAGRACSATALPRGHLRRADRAVHAVPHDQHAAVLPEGGAVGRRAEPRHRRRHAAATTPRPAATTAGATRRWRRRATRSIRST